MSAASQSKKVAVQVLRKDVKVLCILFLQSVRQAINIDLILHISI